LNASRSTVCNATLLLVDGNPLEDIDLIADPHTNFVIIMKDGVISKNTLE
jgi:imidazolonepropionase-like amidohydrolase